MNMDIHIVSAFVDEGSGGNPAGVVIGADHLTQEQKLAIAKEAGLSETAFVSKSHVADFKLEFFTPTRQIAHCGHATIATFGYLKQTSRLNKDWTSKETIDGRREIVMKGTAAYMEQTAPFYEALNPMLIKEIAHSLDLAPDALSSDPIVCSTGNRFVLIEVPDRTMLQSLRPRQPVIQEISERLNLIGYYVFTRVQGGFAATTRMFAPRYGISEEAATGMAAGPLACHLKDHLQAAGNALYIQQGTAMNPPSPSRLHVELEMAENGISRLFVGGEAKVVRSFSMDV